MLLSNASCYKTLSGQVVKVQLEQDGQLHAYDAEGSAVGTYKKDQHVNGWEPVSITEFQLGKAPATAPAVKKPAVEAVPVVVKKKPAVIAEPAADKKFTGPKSKKK